MSVCFLCFLPRNTIILNQEGYQYWSVEARCSTEWYERHGSNGECHSPWSDAVSRVSPISFCGLTIATNSAVPHGSPAASFRQHAPNLGATRFETYPIIKMIKTSYRPSFCFSPDLPTSPPT